MTDAERFHEIQIACDGVLQSSGKFSAGIRRESILRAEDVRGGGIGDDGFSSKAGVVGSAAAEYVGPAVEVQDHITGGVGVRRAVGIPGSADGFGADLEVGHGHALVALWTGGVDGCESGLFGAGGKVRWGGVFDLGYVEEEGLEKTHTESLVVTPLRGGAEGLRNVVEDPERESTEVVYECAENPDMFSGESGKKGAVTHIDGNFKQYSNALCFQKRGLVG